MHILLLTEYWTSFLRTTGLHKSPTLCNKILDYREAWAAEISKILVLSFLTSTYLLCSRVSYSQERHLFHIVVRDGITFLCMADEVSNPLPLPLLECGVTVEQEMSLSNRRNPVSGVSAPRSHAQRRSIC